MLETILLAKLLKINPYDQPAVELIKKETLKVLKKS
jgi:glucose-6-phosphate isomerase